MTDSVTEPAGDHRHAADDGTARASVAPLAHLAWRDVMVAAVVEETADARSLVLDAPHWPGHVAGQHVDVRLTAPDGYQATRSYSLSSGPGSRRPRSPCRRSRTARCPPTWCATSPSATPSAMRGPIGGYFVWAGLHRPLLLVGGGSGLAPLRAMWRAADPTAPVVVLASVTTPARLLYADELADRVRAGTAAATVHLSRAELPPDAVRTGDAARRRSRSAPVGSTRHPSRPPSPRAVARMRTRPSSSAARRRSSRRWSTCSRAAGLDPRAVRAERFG